ncbi:hypothetical protein evm_007678 [Chilo suppressalis]|nr:hypothetical protein evm_007678 [Chilo suppressalis]
MNKKSQKKKQKKRGKGDGGKNKENIVVEDKEGQETDDAAEDTPAPAIAEKPENLCYEVKHSDVMGRYLVASRDIRAGEVIIQEPALAVGPCSGCCLVCLGCYRELDEASLTRYIPAHYGLTKAINHVIATTNL